MSEEVIDLESNNLCITEDVFEKFQVNSMYEEEEIITLPNTSPGSTTISNVASHTDRATSINNLPLIANDQIINVDLELDSQEEDQPEPQIILNTEQTFDDFQVQEEICVQTSNDDVDSKHVQSSNDDVEPQHVQTNNDDVELQHVQSTNDDVEPQQVQTTNDDVDPQCGHTSNDDIEPQCVDTTNIDVKPQHVQSPSYGTTIDEHFASQYGSTSNDSELEIVEISNQDLVLKQPMEADIQISGSNISVNLETQIDSNTVDGPPTTTSTEFNASKAFEHHIHKQPKRRGRKKKNSQDIVNVMSIEEKMSLIHGCEKNSDDELHQSTKYNLDSMNFIPPRQYGRRGRKKNSIQDSKIDTSTDSLIGNENMCEEQENDFVSSGTQLESQSFSETTIKNEPKKRGRKKKNVQLQSSVNVAIENQLNSNADIVVQDTVCEKPSTTKSKRGRKPKNIQYSHKNILDDSEYSVERQMSNLPHKNVGNKSLPSEVEGYITPQKRGRRNNVSSEEQLITLSDLELNSENSTIELEASSSKLSKRRGRPRKIPQEGIKKIHQSLEKESFSNMPEGKIDTENSSPVIKYPGKKKRGRPKKKIVENVHSSDKIEESVAHTEMPSSTCIETIKPEISNEPESLLDGDDIDDICLSNLRKTLDSKNNVIDNIPITNENETEMIANEIKVITAKRSSKMPVMADFEYNIDDIMKAESVETVHTAPITDGKYAEPIEKDKNEIDESLLVEDSSRRPTRRRIKPNLHYDEESDEDPFANVELSDDDEPRGKKGGRYYSDDEYIPHRKEKKRNIRNATESSSNTECELEEESKKQKRKRSYSKKDASLSPRKKGRTNVLDNTEENISVTIPSKEEVPIEDDIEVCLESSVIKTSEISVVISPATNEELSENPTWGTANEFENFIAKKIQGTALKIKKVSSDQSSVTIPPIEIPTMDAKDIKKTVEMCTQTSIVHSKTAAVQTSSHDDVPMKENMSLSKEQSEKACEFLNGIVKTTAELGVLMTQKSEDFMKKKINTSHVIDTFKMDYCVKKSFLLFKLAKRNLMQMEEDLANKYDQFLKTNKLDTYREEVKTILSKSKVDSDSDCEIIEETASKPPVQVKKKTPKFNPKTVFLNKELSIKIAKKPTDDKKLNIKGKHSVWINDSVILKKVKPTQSFLAQDSRNKKPPDCNILTKIVNDFFVNYNRQKALSLCAPFVTTEWFFVPRNFVCNYFVAKPDDFPTETTFSESEGHFLDSTDHTTSNSDPNVCSTINQLKPVNTAIMTSSPKTLLSLCTASIQKQLCFQSTTDIDASKIVTDLLQKGNINPESLFHLCVKVLNTSLKATVLHNDSKSTLSLTTMSYMDNDLRSTFLLNSMSDTYNDLDCPLSMETNTDNNFKNSFSLETTLYMDNNLKNPLSLKTISYMKVLELLNPEDATELSTSNNCEHANTFDSELHITENLHTYSIQVEFSNHEMSNLTTNRVFEEKNGIKTLFSLCVEFIQNEQNRNINNSNMTKLFMPISLKSIAYRKLIDCMYDWRSKDFDHRKCIMEDQSTMIKKNTLNTVYFDNNPKRIEDQSTTMSKKSLSTVDFDKTPIYHCMGDQLIITKVKTLSNICLEKIISLQNKTLDSREAQSLTINSVNTMSEEAFLNIKETSQENEYFADSDCENDFEPEYDFEESVQNNISDDSNWVTQLQLGELKSGVISTVTNIAEKNVQNESTIDASCDIPAMVHIKCEPQDEFLNSIVDPSIVKSEIDHNYDELVITLENVTTKAEKECPAAKDPILRHDSTSYDVDAFESFVISNKMMLGSSEEIFSQSTLRVHRQHEPDSDNENDLNMSLLIPHTSVLLPVDNAKTTLMESSSDENKSKEILTKKKTDKRKKRTRKIEIKPISKDTLNATKNKSALTNEKATSNNEKATSNNEKPTSNNEKSILNNEVAILTRRMRVRIRQEEKKIESSDSDIETRSLRSKADKKKDEQDFNIKQNTLRVQCEENEIQCNNVDSTEQISENIDKHVNKQQDIPDEAFTGFTAIDQNAILDYEKYIQEVYNKILPQSDSPVRYDNELQSHSINTDGPIEYLECEPTLSIFDNEVKKKVSKKSDKSVLKCKAEDFNKPEVSDKLNTQRKLKESEIVYELSKPEKSEIINKLGKLEVSCTMDLNKQLDNNILSKADIAETEPEPKPFVERYGWHCYPIASNDSKIYEHCEIPLDKLPESFVEMYFQYQAITDQSKEDEEVDRLINLQSLNRLTFTKDNVNSKGKVKVKTEPSDNAQSDFSNGSGAATPVSDHYQELTASEDEQQNNDIEMSPPIPVQTSENNMAKDSLMDDNDTDIETAANQLDEDQKLTEKVKPIEEVAPKRRRPGPKSKCKLEEPKPDNSDLMLTADKVMKEELTLLHAPIVLKDTKETPQYEIRTRSKQKSTTKNQSERSQIKAEDDSSSEEEKQWVNTKEKLLKRLEKRHETANADDAKRAKVVSEFIERREGAVPRQKKTRRRSRKMTRKFLERQKQLSVLSKELFGESSDGVYAGKRSVTSYSKGRRNIRKVLDKKSLGRNTVLANMEEFERKRRLNIRQCRLRELLGCEEGVNVLVINDELCLEYDFEEQQPVVTVHPFFTKIMKAHQYEGVKFMWDACFESLAHMAAGHPGGGCILAHCMGLGKTLQVLALLHTVLTHPGVGMHRVLVCCPLSTVLNWVDEIHKWIGPVTNQMKVFELSKLKKTYERAYQLEDWYNGGGIFIIGYELFRSLTTLDPFLDDVRPTIINKIRTALLDPGPDIIICDEGHLLKNDLSVLAVAMSRVVTKRRIVLTGTPMQNNLREYYCMVNFVKPNLLGTYAEYSNRFENPIMNGQHRDSSEEDIKLMKARTHILHKVLEGCLQRMEASVLYPYLPKKYEYTVFISLTKCQWDLYKHYLMAYCNKNKQSILKDFHQLQKIWSHPQVLHNFQMRLRDQNATKLKEEKLEDDLASEELAASVGPDVKPPDTEVWWLPYLEGGSMLDSLDSSNKFVVVFRILDECMKLGDKVLIFSTSLFTMDALEYFLRKINKWSLGQEYFRLDGSVPPEVRQKWCREFNAENNIKTKLFLISTRAGSLGLNMTAANRVIILDTSWNPAHDIQSIFRVYRFGQKKDCYIYRLVALGTMEQKIYERSVTKQAVSCRVVDEQQIDRHYNMAELTELYRFDEEGSGVQSGVAAGVRDVALLRVARLRAMHAVHEHDSLLRGSEPALPEHERQAAWVQFQYQQEHEHMQMQNELVGNATKRPYARVAKLANGKMLKMETDPQDPDFKPEPKKRGRKTRAQAQEANGAPELTPKLEEYILDPEIEQDKIKKIAEILIKYNFQDVQMQTMLPQLVMNVRRMVATGQRNGFMQCDELTASIANILLEKTDVNMPVVTNVMSKSASKTITEEQSEQQSEKSLEDTPMEDTAEKNVQQPVEQAVERPLEQTVEQTVEQPVEQPVELSVEQSVEQPVEKPPIKKYKPGPKCKKGYVYEEIPATSATRPTESEYDVRAKRRAALAAEKLLETAGKSVIDVDDDDSYAHSDTDSAPETVLQDHSDKTKSNKTRISEKKQVQSEKMQIQSEKTQIQSPTVEKVSKLRVRKLQKQPDSAITLSDDEESVAEKGAEGSPEATPLHPSLLQNANFIKIVAHTYLAGNPMLDEDAATLAARYSTYKALKELERTGKAVTCGPIYDIAVKVLGIDILKKLHKTDTKLGAHASLLVPSQPPVQEPPVEMSKITPKTRKSARAASKTAKADLPSPATPTVTAARSVPLTMPPLVAAPRPVESNVVPVGLFKTTMSIPTGGPKRETVEESILPDDEEVHIVSSPPLVSPSPPPPLLRGNAKPVVVRAVRAGRSGPVIDPAKLGVPAHPIPSTAPTPIPNPTTPAPPPPRDYGTICLDSDDEDAPPSSQTPVGTWYTVPPKSSYSSMPASNVPPTMTTAPIQPTTVRIAPRRSGSASNSALTLTGDPATIILTKNYGRTPPSLSDTMSQNVQAIPRNPGSGLIRAKPTRLFMIPSSTVAGMNPALIPISVSMPTGGQPQVSQHLYQHTILPDVSADNAESILPTPTSIFSTPTSILPTPTSILPTPTSILPTPTSVLPTPTSILPTPTSILPTPTSVILPTPTSIPTTSTSILPNPTSVLPTPTYGAPNATPVPPIAPKKKAYKSHDIIRISKNGQIELITRSGDIELIDTSKIAPKAANKTTEIPKPVKKTPALPKIAPKLAPKAADISNIVPKPGSKNTRQSITEKETVKKSNTSNVSKPAAIAPVPAPQTRRVSSDSSGDSRPATPNDPLSILKDVVHIQADEYAKPTKSNPAPMFPNRKCFALTEGPSASPGILSTSTTASVTSQHTNKTSKPSNTLTKKKTDVSKSRVSNELVVDSVDLTESGSSIPPPSSAVKKTDVKAKKATSTVPTSSAFASTPKNTSSVSKILRVKTEKGVISKTGPKNWSDSKKRPITSVDSNPSKKKKVDQPMTLEDFDIDDIDDIIELD